MEQKVIEGYPNYLISDTGVVFNKRTNREQKPRLDKDGYYVLGLSCNGVKKIHRVHRLVAQAFIPNPDNLDTVNHINHNKTDNRVQNLEWMDNIDNARDGNKGITGEKASAAKLTQEQAREIRRLYSTGMKQKEIAKIYNVTQMCISNVVRNKVYKEEAGQ